MEQVRLAPPRRLPARIRRRQQHELTAIADRDVRALGRITDAPPTTYAVDGRQYIAVATGLTRNSMGRLATTPEKRNLGKSATMIFVFAL